MKMLDAQEELDQLIEESENTTLPEKVEAQLRKEPTPKAKKRAVVKAVATAPSSAYNTVPVAPVWTQECERQFIWCRRINFVCWLLHLINFGVCLGPAIAFSSFSQTLFIENFNSDRQLRLTGSWAVAPVYLTPIFSGVMMCLHFFQWSRCKLWKERWLIMHCNTPRWLAYSVASSVAMVCVGILCGLATYGSLVLLVVCQASSVHLLSWTMEHMNPMYLSQSLIHTWMPLLLGMPAALAVWAAIGVPFFASINHLPAYVLGLYFSVGVTYFSHPIITIYQHVGKRSLPKYLRGECAHMIASAVFYTALAYQVVGGAMQR